jgi:addiction module HigA family antidote
MLPKNRPPTHPGEILKEDYLLPLEMTQAALAHKMGVAEQTINLLVNGKRDITPKTALGLAEVFGTTPQFWMNLQANVDLWEERRRSQAK